MKAGADYGKPERIMRVGADYESWNGLWKPEEPMEAGTAYGSRRAY